LGGAVREFVESRVRKKVAFHTGGEQGAHKIIGLLKRRKKWAVLKGRSAQK